MSRQVHRLPGIKPLTSGRYQARVFHHGFEESRTFTLLDEAKRWQRNLKKDMERAPGGITRRKGLWSASLLSPSGVVSKMFQSLDEAILWFNSGTAIVAAGGELPPSDAATTASELVVLWRQAHPSVGTKTFATYNSQLGKHILPEFGNRIVAQIAAAEIQSWVNGLTKRGVGAPTVIASYKLLHQIFEFAVELSLLHRNPCQKIRLPKRVAKTGVALTKEQLKSLAQESMDYEDFILFLGLTGLRIGEALALNVEDVDLGRNSIRVNKSVTTSESGAILKYETSTKTGKARNVPVAQSLIPSLVQRIGARPSDAPLFTGAQGGRLNYGWFRRSVFEPAKLKAGLQTVTIHSLRHTCASLLIHAGAPVTAVSHILGHASVKMTLDVYSHFYQSDSELWINQLGVDLYNE